MSQEMHKTMDSPLKVPFCPCGELRCQELSAHANRLLGMLYEYGPNVADQSVIALLVISRLLVEGNIPVSEAARILIDNMVGTYRGLIEEYKTKEANAAPAR